MTWVLTLLLLLLAVPAGAAKRAPDPPKAACRGPSKPVTKTPPADPDAKAPAPDASDVWSEGTVTVGGTAIDYCAAAGTLTVHPADWDDAAPAKADAEDGTKNPSAVASMFYVAYFKRDAAVRPIMFLFNGGPGSATVWLHMGAFGPRRVEMAGTEHAPAAPYRLVNNDRSLLDVSDLVFIDAPGTGFSRIGGGDKDKSFYGVDEDAQAFAAFIAEFLSKYKRWNAPKYLFGESYGTARAAVLVNRLQNEPGVDFNGVVMLSQVLANALYPDDPKSVPGNDLPYTLALPSFAATAWFYNQPADRRADPVPPALLADVERFAMGDYAAALAAGAALEPARRDEIVTKLAEYTGVSVEYWRRADLRVSIDAFRQELLRDRGLIVGTTDSRYRGFALDRTSKHATYDPTEAATTSAYVSSFNDYVRRVLLYGEGKTYRPSSSDIVEKWSYRHKIPDSDTVTDGGSNVMPDLARAMKYNPLLKIQLNAGYFDLITPYFQGMYEMRHLPVPAELQANIEYRCYQAGHMPYLRADALARLHDNVADFVERTSNLPPRQGTKRTLEPGCSFGR